MSDDEVDTPVAESTIGKALKEQCKLDKEMMGLMKVNNSQLFFILSQRQPKNLNLCCASMIFQFIGCLFYFRLWPYK